MTEPTIHDAKRKPVISAELADAIADLLTEYDIPSPYSVDYSNKDADGKPRQAYLHIPYDFSALPKFWTLEVAKVISLRKMAEYKAAYHKAVNELNGQYVTVVVRCYLHDQYDADGRTKPEACSLARLRKTFQATYDNDSASVELSKMPILRLDHAIFFNRRPDAWADYASYIVPLDLNPVKSVARDALLKTLHAFVDACRTSNGMAGYGSSWTVHIHPSMEFAILTSRSSIAE